MYITEEDAVKYNNVLHPGDRIRLCESGFDVISLAGLDGYAIGTVLNSTTQTGYFTLVVKFAKLPTGEILQNTSSQRTLNYLNIACINDVSSEIKDGSYVIVSPLVGSTLEENDYKGLVHIGLPDLLNVVDDVHNIYELVGTVKTVNDKYYELAVLLEKTPSVLGIANLTIHSDDLADIEVGDRLCVEIQLIDEEASIAKELKRSWKTFLVETLENEI